ncbi:MAG: aldo/keto reductase [Bryobacteraceae bacterium]
MHSGSADSVGTHDFASRFPDRQFAGFFREAHGLAVSSIGIGTYLGEMDEATDRGYTESVERAVRLGVNVIDTSLNYRHQRSERSVGAALRHLFACGDAGGYARRNEILVCTKAGYLIPNALPQGLLAADVVGGMHSLCPAFLADQLERSRKNLNLETIDVFYLHNPETQLEFLEREPFHDRIRAAFEFLEEQCRLGTIRFYGAATWNGFRHTAGGDGTLSLGTFVNLAREAAGAGHHFRFVQLPLNLAMPEGFANGVLSQAREFNITVVASASLLQGRLSRGLPDEITARLPGIRTDAQRALQFTRSTPGVTVALAGMSRVAHVEENLELSSVPPAGEEQYLSLYQNA